MKKINSRGLISAVILICFFSRCNFSNSSDAFSITTDTATIHAGEISFNKNCSGCHNFRQDGIGPQLSGITTAVDAEWIRHFIKDPRKIISSGDKRASELLVKYKVAMPSFASLNDDDLDAIIAYLHSQKLIRSETKPNANVLNNPISETIKLSDLVVNLEPFAEIPPSNDSAPRARITKLDFQPSTGTLFIVDLRGKLFRIQDQLPAMYMDIGKLKPQFINEPGLATGFGSFAFHPGFAKNGLLYTTHTEVPNSGTADFTFPDSIKVAAQWVLTEWKANDPSSPVFSGSGRELFRVNMPSGIHGVQEITFNPRSKPGENDYGLLYIGIGDGGCVENGFEFLVHSKDRIWGTVLRINPAGSNSKNGHYGIPADNPFSKVQNDKVVKEIYAFGFRNPHRITWTNSGQMLVCNIGQGNIEAIDLIEPGNDYGWPLREGTFVSSELNANQGKVSSLPLDDSIYKITYPVAQYDHDEGNAISGGFEYSGSAVPRLKGKFLFGDIPTGRLFFVEVAGLKQGRQAAIKEWKISVKGTIRTLKELCGNDRVDLHFGKDIHGDMYILTKADGKVYRLSP